MHELLGFDVLTLRTHQPERKKKKMHSKTGNKTSKEENEINQNLSKRQCAGYTAGFTLPESIVGRAPNSLPSGCPHGKTTV